MVSKINSIFITLALSIFLAQSVESATIPYTMNKRFSEIYQHGHASDKLENRQNDDNDAIYMKRAILSGNNKRLKDLIPNSGKRQNDEDTIYVKREILGVNERVGDVVHVKQPSKRQDVEKADYVADSAGVKAGSHVNYKQTSKRQNEDENALYVKRNKSANDRVGDRVQIDQKLERPNEDTNTIYVKRTILSGDNQRLKDLVHVRQNDDEDANYVKRDSLEFNGRTGDHVHVQQSSKRQDVDKGGVYTKNGNKIIEHHSKRENDEEEEVIYFKRDDKRIIYAHEGHPSKRQIDDVAYAKKGNKLKASDQVKHNSKRENDNEEGSNTGGFIHSHHQR